MSASRARAGRLFAALLPVAVGLGMLVWTWGKWPDVLVDFGRELYVPWRLLEGERLYAELAWFNGPLSPHLNALWFRLFGVSLWTLVGANLALLALLATLAWRRLDAEAGPWAAAAGTVAFLVVFAFGHLTGIGNYNFVTPYSHELTHGLLAAVAALVALGRFRATGRTAPLVLGGAALGLAFLTKAEVFLAAAGGAACLLLPAPAPAPAPRTPGTRGRAGRLALAAGGALGVAALAFALLAARLPAATAARGVLGTWAALSTGGGTPDLVFYRELLGIDEPAANALALATWSAAHAVLFGGLWLLDRRVGPRAGTPAAGAAAFALLAAAGLIAPALGAPVAWVEALRPLPLVLLVLALARGARAARTADADERERAVRDLAWTVFALLLLAKIALDARPSHYGFALALPATLVYVAWLVGRAPAGLRARGGGALFRGAVLGVLLAALVGLSRTTALQLSRKTFALGEGADRFVTDPYRGPAVARALERVEQTSGPDATLLVLPEGISLNYLARRRTPTPYPNFMPPELAIFGEDAIVAALEAAPPDTILLVHKDTSEYGLPFFGTDYGLAIARWVVARYQVVHAIGQPPLQPGTVFGIHVLQRP